MVHLAGVAELVDALDSGSSVRKDVRVQISPSAPTTIILRIDLLKSQFNI